MHATHDPTARATILVVDDVPENLALLAGILQGRYAVRAANSGPRALQLLRRGSLPDLVLLDVVMPEMDGYAVCGRIKQDPRTRDIPVIFLTVLDDAVDEEMGLGMGAVDYIAKPVSPPIVLARIAAQLRLKATADFLRDQNQFLEHEVARRLAVAERQYDAIIGTMAGLLHARAFEGGRHVQRLQAGLQALADRLQLDPRYAPALTEEAVRLMVKAVPLYDIGMADVPDRILFKAGALSTEERGIVRRHAEHGHTLLQHIAQELGGSTPLLQMAGTMARAHQERWDGSGYPHGLAGEAIAPAARLVAVVDAYEALASGRLYRQPVPHAQAVQAIAEGRGTQFDPGVVDAFLDIQAEFQRIAQQLADTAGAAATSSRAIDAVGGHGA
ncbi:response regulator [Pseudorhodoferax soli]|uniref:Putative two-component system response regulator n=1 Tax=Pseudorhodoferax soli TaxID=545864 RepID=A0A368XUL4_9BURK|nr:HD domain-containing phosphohydrolase [Pseudorhodoferax soli]RCW71642.1 putative two-component system response regulator [Pseudorhodoferax soli]